MDIKIRTMLEYSIEDLDAATHHAEATAYRKKYGKEIIARRKEQLKLIKRVLAKEKP